MNVVMKSGAAVRRAWGWLMAPDPPSPRQGALPLMRRGPLRELLFALALGGLAGAIGWAADVWPWLLVAAPIGVFVLALLRRRLPVPVLMAIGALAGVMPGYSFVVVPLAWSAGRRIERSGYALLAFTASYVAYSGAALLQPGSANAPVLAVVLSTLTFLPIAVVPGLASRYFSQRRTLLHALQERNAQLLWERQMVADQARLLERQRIAQDMHDSLGHQLALIAVHTGALEVDPELTDRQREAVGVLRNASVGAMHELREVVGILRDGVETAVAPVDESGRAARGTAGVQALVETARSAGTSVGLRSTGERRPLAAAADHAAYRIVQESLTNAYKHAPGAWIEVELRYEPDSLVVEIVNGPAVEGATGEVVSGGQGLTGLRERARLVGGIVHAGTTDGGGFRVAGVLPYGVAEAAPFVAVPDDFPRQPAPPPQPHGVPVMNWNVAGQGPRMNGMHGAGGQGSRIGAVGIGCGISLAALVLLGALTVVGGYFFFTSLDDSMVTQSEYEEIEIGTPEDEVRDRLPDEDSVWASDLKGGKGEPKQPEGADCMVVMSEEMGSTWEKEPVFRFCFKDGKLIEKTSYEVVVDF
ncbi:sensor histidine kinase [Streptomyces sp. NPDC003860]